MSLLSIVGWRVRATLLFTVLFAVVGTTTVLAHEGREVGDYNFVVGFINEPAIEGMVNGVSVRITSLKEADDHEHEAEAGMDMSDGMEPEIDLVSHGGVFVDELAAEASYEFTFGHDFEGLTVPFHAHPIETQGSIMIGPNYPAADEVVVQIHDHGFEPAMVMIQPDTKVTFENHMSEPTVVMSGPLGEVAMTDGAPTARNAVTGLTTLKVNVVHMASMESHEWTLTEAFGDPGHYKAEFIPTWPGGYRFEITGDIEGTAIDETFESSNTTFDEVTPASDLQFPVKLAAPRETENAAKGALDAATEASSEASDASSSASTATVLSSIALVLGLAGLAFGVVAYRRSGVHPVPDRLLPRDKSRS